MGRSTGTLISLRASRKMFSIAPWNNVILKGHRAVGAVTSGTRPVRSIPPCGFGL